jgi:hypothetical protein
MSRGLFIEYQLEQSGKGVLHTVIADGGTVIERGGG